MPVFEIIPKNARAFRAIVGTSLRQFDFLIKDVEKICLGAEGKGLGRPAGRGRGPHEFRLWTSSWDLWRHAAGQSPV